MVKGEIIIDEKSCKGCSYCAKFCAHGCIVISGERFTPQWYPLPTFVNHDKCNACGICGWMCPEFAIEVYKYVEKEATSA